MAETWTDQGGYLSKAKLNKQFQVSAQPLLKFRQFCDFKSSLGKNQGESENWLRIADVGTYGGSLDETETMHETTQAKSWGTITITEYGNSIPTTSKVKTLSQFDVDQYVKKGLLNDAVRCLDGLAERQFNACKLRYVGTTTAGYALTTNGTATAVNTSVLNSYHLRKMALELKKRNVPGYNSLNGDYVAICSIEALESLRGALEATQQYTESGYKALVNGEVGRYGGVRIVEDGFASRYVYDAAARTATAKTWSGALSLDAYVFGADTVMEAIAVREEIRGKEPTDYGRSHGLAWYYLGGFKIVWEDATNARIIKWDSAS